MRAKRIFSILVACFLGCLALITIWQQGLAWKSAQRPVNQLNGEGELESHFTSTLANDEIRFMVILTGTADLHAVPISANEVTRRQEIIQYLQETAVSSQQALQPLLNQLQDAGHISRVQTFWITNAIGVTGDAEALQRLANHPAVASIRAEEVLQIDQNPLYETVSEPETTTLASRNDIIDEAWGVSRVRAPYVWQGLGIDGQGVTVAIMDSGVDWLHPDLHDNYRGNLGNGNFQHEGNWFNAADPTIVEPQDWMWHGTHVAGTAVGQNNLGVAPGAQWIAVAIANADGSIPESAIHAGFEWLLAPAGDPSLAPDIINCSWGSSSPYWNGLINDIEILHAAGIIPVFSAGNNGSLPGTVGAPASYADTLSVGASDKDDEIAWFSSRGPSPFTTVPKPHISAPGARILSALPDAQYGYASGTSMATPHVAGTIALLLSANPNFTEGEIWQRLAETAIPMTETHPNNDSGWGRLDAYAAVLPSINTGSMTGAILHNGQPVVQAAIFVTNNSGNTFLFESDENGRYAFSLQPGSYELSISAFGYTPVEGISFTLTAAQTIDRDFELTALPGGTVQGTVLEGGTNTPLTATISVEGTPVTAVADNNGHYAIELPAGTYTMIVSHLGHRLIQKVVTLLPGSTLSNNFLLNTAPKLLLIEAGAWYYNSHIQTYQTALTAERYYADLWVIKDPYNDIPLTTTLTLYDTVIWADPQGSPGYISADYHLTEYLEKGGNFLVSGQNVAFYDDSSIFPAYWWYGLLKGKLLGKWFEEIPPPVSGVAETLFSDLDVVLTGQNSSTPQYPDSSRPAKNSLTTPILQFPNGDAAGLQAGTCEEYRIVYFGFGLEGVVNEEIRSDLLGRSMDFFASPRQEWGVAWRSTPIDDFVIPGQDSNYEILVQNQSELITDTFTITPVGDLWPSSILTPTMEIGPCTIAKALLTVEVPTEVQQGMTHTVRVTAVSNLNPSISDTFLVQQRVPVDFLLVDDDRWYEYEERYESILAKLDVTYDVWDIGGTAATAGRGSPPAELLQQYDAILWFTGYDWFQPVTPDERNALESYLQNGGRLFLSSQDYLYYNFDSSFTRNFLGVYNFQETISPTHLYAGLNQPLGDPLGGPYQLDYGRAKNFSDSVMPAPHSQAIAWNQNGTASALATSKDQWRTVFWSVPFEFLTDTVRTEAMHGIFGWLSDLGNTTFKAGTRQGHPGEILTYTLSIGKIESAPKGPVTITNHLPEGLEPWLPTLPPELEYDQLARTLSWSGVLEGGKSQLISYQAVIGSQLPNGTQVENRVSLAYERHSLQFDRVATVWVNTPDVASSEIIAEVFTPLPYQFVRYTMTLRNESLVAADGITAVLHLPGTLTPLAVTLQTSSGTAVLDENKISWQGDVIEGSDVIVSLLTWRHIDVKNDWVAATAFIDDGVTRPLVRTAVSYLQPYTQHMPIIRQ